MKKIMHIVGNRPQFIKLAPVSREIRERGYKDIIIHTGQHFDENMSDVFFQELEIPQPDENLQVSGGSHAQMTAHLMMAIEPVVLKYNPDIVLVYGDTNSTLAAAITAKKLGKRIAHVEAGERSLVEMNPEEINRRMIDHISDILFVSDQPAYQNLAKENLENRIVFSGDTMYDSFLRCGQIAKNDEKYQVPNLPDRYVLMTWHRQETTDTREHMKEVLDLIKCVKMAVVCPLHPRTKKMLQEFGLWDETCQMDHFVMIDPVGYVEMINLINNSTWILTDSGGLSKEAYYAKKRCVYMVDLRCWPELEKGEWIIHLEETPSKTIERIEQLSMQEKDNVNELFGDGHAGKKIVDYLENMGL